MLKADKQDEKRVEVKDKNCESEISHRQNPLNGLSRETYNAVKHTNLAISTLSAQHSRVNSL